MTHPAGIGSGELLGAPGLGPVLPLTGIGSGEMLGATTLQLAPPVLLNEEMADDAEEVIVAWLTPLRPSGNVRLPGDPLPFTLVTHITGSENEQEDLSEPVVSVHTLCDRLLGWSAAKDETRKTHQRMLRLARHCDDIPITGRVANIEWMDVVESPIWVEYGDDAILQKVGRYRLGLSFVAVPVITTFTEAT
jgi:hypothetical protein